MANTWRGEALRHAMLFAMGNAQGVVLEIDANVTQGKARVTFHCDAPTQEVRVRDARSLGRAEAEFDGKSWSAKHYWVEGNGEERTTVYQFDEALAAGEVTLLIPVA